MNAVQAWNYGSPIRCISGISAFTVIRYKRAIRFFSLLRKFYSQRHFLKATVMPTLGNSKRIIVRLFFLKKHEVGWKRMGWMEKTGNIFVGTTLALKRVCWIPLWSRQFGSISNLWIQCYFFNADLIFWMSTPRMDLAAESKAFSSPSKWMVRWIWVRDSPGFKAAAGDEVSNS